MFALVTPDVDPSGTPATIVRELFETNPNFPASTGLTVIDVSNVPGVAVGWIMSSHGTVAAYTPAAPTAAQLLSYLPVSQNNLMAVGKTVNVAASGQAPVNVLCDAVPATRADLAMLALNGQANPASTKTWLDNKGVATVLTGAQFVTLATAMGSWIDDLYAQAAALMEGISAAPPTITTTTQIDAAFAAVTS